MRIGEVLGLHWKEVDWQTSQIRVTCSLSWESGGRPEIIEPKTPNSRRNIKVDSKTMEALRLHRKRQLEDRLRAAPRGRITG